LAKSKNVKTRKKQPARKKSGRGKQSQSLLPALIFLGLAAGLIAVLYLFVGRYPSKTSPPSGKEAVSKLLPKNQLQTKAITGKEKKGRRNSSESATTARLSHLTIYRLSHDFSHTLSLTIPCDPDSTEIEKIQQIIRYLTLPGERDQAPLPRATRLRAVSFTAPLITIDLSEDVRKSLINSGANDEMLTVACLTNSLLANFPDCKTLQILIDGKTNKTMAGHIDISQPLTYQAVE